SERRDSHTRGEGRPVFERGRSKVGFGCLDPASRWWQSRSLPAEASIAIDFHIKLTHSRASSKLDSAAGEGVHRPDRFMSRWRSRMPDGYMGKILRVDLSTGSMKDEPLPDEAVLRKYVGGKGLALWYLM